MQREIPTKKSEYIYLVKCLSIVSVVSAHCASLPEGQSGFPWYSALLLRNVGTVGVLCFLIMAGYLYRPQKYTLRQLVWKKVTSVLLPWLAAGTVFYRVVYGYNWSIVFKAVAGYRSPMYYLAMLTVCYLFFYVPACRKKSVCIAMAFITLLSTVFFYDLPYRVFLVPFGIDPHEWVGYLNPLNWMGYFALGVMAQTEWEKWKRVLFHCYTGCLCVTVFAAAVIWQVLSGSPGSYFGGGGNGVVRISGAITVLYAAHFITERKSLARTAWYHVAAAVGRDSYFLYLWHFTAIYWSMALFRNEHMLPLVLIRPAWIILITAAADFLIRKINHRYVKRVVIPLLGIR